MEGRLSCRSCLARSTLTRLFPLLSRLFFLQLHLMGGIRKPGDFSLSGVLFWPASMKAWMTFIFPSAKVLNLICLLLSFDDWTDFAGSISLGDSPLSVFQQFISSSSITCLLLILVRLSTNLHSFSRIFFPSLVGLLTSSPGHWTPLFDIVVISSTNSGCCKLPCLDWRGQPGSHGFV